jgi:glutamine synthetase
MCQSEFVSPSLTSLLSSAYSIYGFDNREAAIRVPSLFKGREAASINLELKPSDHSGNPYLAIGALIAAGLDGLHNQIDPGESVDVDPADLSDEERERRGIERLPASLDEALDALEQDQVLLAALGPLLATSYIAVKRSEAAYFADKTPEEEARQHFYKY